MSDPYRPPTAYFPEKPTDVRKGVFWLRKPVSLWIVSLLFPNAMMVLTPIADMLHQDHVIKALPPWASWLLVPGVPISGLIGMTCAVWISPRPVSVRMALTIANVPVLIASLFFTIVILAKIFGFSAT